MSVWRGGQSEKHVLVECELVSDIRRKYGHEVFSFESFMNDRKNKPELLMLHEMLKRVET